MNKRDIICDALLKVAGDSCRLLVLHSSLTDVTGREALSKWDYLSALKFLSGAGITFALPTFTYEFCRSQPFDIARSPSETGILGSWLLEIDGARRTPDPIYSFAVIGPLAEDLCRAGDGTAFGAGSIFARFEKADATLVMMGCGWQACTQFHRYEEEARVPYRYDKTFSGQADFGAGRKKTDTVMYVRDLDMNAAYDVTRAVQPLITAAKVKSTALFNGTVQGLACRDFAASCRQLLKADPLAFLTNRADVERELQRKSAAAKNPPLRLAVLGSANNSMLVESLETQLAETVIDRRVEIYEPPFGQMEIEILNPKSSLNTFSAGVVFFVDRIEDILGVDRIDDLNEDTNVYERIDNYCSMISALAKNGPSLIIVNKFAASRMPAPGDQEWIKSGGTREIVTRANGLLEDYLNGFNNIHLFDVAEAKAALSGGAVFDPRLWYVGRIGYSQEFTAFLASRYSAVVAAQLGLGIRLLVIDLDNTLWGGILGEDEISGIAVGGDFPGNAFRSFQLLLRTLRERGIALAISSKNDETHALEAMERLPGMILKASDFVGLKINWRPKWQNILELSEELDLGLQNIGFVDDNPAERDLVRRNLPQVRVVDLPDDPAGYGEALLSSPFITGFALTREDKTRSANYQARQKIESARQSFDNLESFYGSLESRITMEPLADTNINRVSQLIIKTNQYNATTRRHSVDDLKRLASKKNAGVYGVWLKDKYSEREIIGVVILDGSDSGGKKVEIDTFLLSCRVLGRGLEAGILHWAAETAKAWGSDALNGEIILTERNTPVRDLYKDHGFKAAGNGRWRLDLKTYDKLAPVWLAIDDGVENQMAPV
jgi:FkbH-like protein